MLILETVLIQSFSCFGACLFSKIYKSCLFSKRCLSSREYGNHKKLLTSKGSHFMEVTLELYCTWLTITFRLIS